MVMTLRAYFLGLSCLFLVALVCLADTDEHSRGRLKRNVEPTEQAPQNAFFEPVEFSPKAPIIPRKPKRNSHEEDVSRALKIVNDVNQNRFDVCSKDGENPTLGTGAVQKYGVERFVNLSLTAVHRANLLTRLWTKSRSGEGKPSLPLEEFFFYHQVSNFVNSHPDIFAAGNCYDKGEFPGRDLFCPYAYRGLQPKDGGKEEVEDVNRTTPSSGDLRNVTDSVDFLRNSTEGVHRQKHIQDEAIRLTDLSVGYDYIDPPKEWFEKARNNSARIIAERASVIEYWDLRRDKRDKSEPVPREVLLVEYNDGHWSEPYFDCGGGDIWMMTYTVPFFGYDGERYKFKGTSGIDIDLQKMDINQCPNEEGAVGAGLSNPFANTSRCHSTTKCVPLHGRGFRGGSYDCVCADGYYFPPINEVDGEKRYKGSDVERAYNKGSPEGYSYYTCLPCAEGCETCKDASPCILELDMTMRAIILTILLLLSVCGVPALGVFVWVNRKVKVMKAASPMLLGVILSGAFLLYCPMILDYFGAHTVTCSLRLWFRGIGFSVAYGSVLLKTWRVSLVFRVRSAQRVKISDSYIMKRLAFIVLAFMLYLSVRMVFGRPSVALGHTQDKLKTYQCSFDVWDYIQSGGELLMLLCGIRLCVMVRKAPSQFNESRFISWAIYNETLLSLFLHLSAIFLRSPSNPDLLYIIQFIHINLTITGTLIFLFLSKAFLMYKMRNEEAQGQRRGASRSSSSRPGFKYGNKRPPLQEAPSDDFHSSNNNNNTNMEGELKRLYTELEVYKEMEMRRGNPHLPLTKVINSSSSRMGIMEKISVFLSSGSGCTTKQHHSSSTGGRFSTNGDLASADNHHLTVAEIPSGESITTFPASSASAVRHIMASESPLPTRAVSVGTKRSSSRQWWPFGKGGRGKSCPNKLSFTASINEAIEKEIPDRLPSAGYRELVMSPTQKVKIIPRDSLTGDGLSSLGLLSDEADDDFPNSLDRNLSGLCEKKVNPDETGESSAGSSNETRAVIDHTDETCSMIGSGETVRLGGSEPRSSSSIQTAPVDQPKADVQEEAEASMCSKEDKENDESPAITGRCLCSESSADSGETVPLTGKRTSPPQGSPHGSPNPNSDAVRYKRIYFNLADLKNATDV